MLQRLGFDIDLMFEKRRESWTLEDCKIEIDELPHLGQFVEIEAASETTIMNLRAKLGLNDLSLERRSYAELLSAHVRENNLSRRITFST